MIALGWKCSVLFASHISRAVALLLIALAAFAVTAVGQAGGGIAGTVRDPSGAVVAGARVVVHSSATGYQRIVITGGSGDFVVPLLPPGNYEVKIEAAGFRTLILPEVRVTVTETTSLNSTLAIGPVSETMTVSAAPPIQKDGPQLGRVVPGSAATALPLATRNFTQILTLSPGTATYLPDSTGVGRNTQLISVNGARASQNNVQINGVDVNTLGSNGPILLPVPAPEAIQEFKVQTALYDAAFGRSGGGNIQVVTKGGTNDMHGSAYEYLRNDALNANNPFLKAAGVQRPVLQRNTFGATLGGPIKRNRAFFFASYQGAGERNGASIINSISSNVLIAPGLTDDRSAATLLSTFKPTLRTGQPAASIGTSALALLNARLPGGAFLIPTPQLNGHYSGSAVSRFEENQGHLRVDYYPRPNNVLSATAFLANSTEHLAIPSFRGAGPNVPGFGSEEVLNHRLLMVQDIHTFSSTLTNEARLGYSLNWANTVTEEPVLDSDLGILRSNAAQHPGLGLIRIAPASGGIILGTAPTADGRRTPSTTTFADTASLIHGPHTLRTGFEFRYNLINFNGNTSARGQIDFASFNDFLVGTSSRSILGDGIGDRAFRATDYNLFFQDNWRLSPNLMLSLGLRYELDLPPYDTLGRLSTFDPALYQPRPLIQNGNPLGPPIGGIVQAANVIPELNVAGVPKVDKRIVKSIDPHNFAPRLGFAWSPFRSGKSVLHGGYGIYFSRPSFHYLSQTAALPPLYVLGLRTGAPLSDPFFAAPPEQQFPMFIPGITLSGNVFDRNLHTPYIHQFGLSVQQELPNKLLLEMAYVGTRGVNLFRLVAINQSRLATVQAPIINDVTGAVITTNTPDNAALRAPFQGVDIAGFAQNQSTAASSYNSLQATLTKRVSTGLQFLASYTYAKSIDNASGQGGGAGVVGIINPSAVGDSLGVLGDQRSSQSNRGVSDFDRTQRLAFSYVWDLPLAHFAERSWAGRTFLSSWNLSGVVTTMSGLPIDVVDTKAGSLYGLAGGSSPLARPGFAPGFSDCSAATHNIPPGYFFNPFVFARPIVGAGQPIPSSRGTAIADALGTDIGNVGRNCLRGPGQTNVDFAVARRFKFSESRILEFRGEFFNLLNQVNLANPISNLNAADSSGGKINAHTGQVESPGDFGRIVGTSNNPRLIQLALKFSF